MGLRKYLCAFVLAALVAGCSSGTSTTDGPPQPKVFTFSGRWHSVALDTIYRSVKPGDYYVVGDTLTLSNTGGMLMAREDPSQLQTTNIRSIGVDTFMVTWTVPNNPPEVIELLYAFPDSIQMAGYNRVPVATYLPIH